MPALTIEYGDAHERLALEPAMAYIAQLRQLALTAGEGWRPANLLLQSFNQWSPAGTSSGWRVSAGRRHRQQDEQKFVHYR